MKDCLNFYQYVVCLTIDKNNIPDPQVIRMSYLKFIISLSQQDENKYLYEYLTNLLYLVFKGQPFHIDFEKDKFYIKILNEDEDIKIYNLLINKYKEMLKRLNIKDKNNDINQENVELYNTVITLNENLKELINTKSVILIEKDFNKIRKIILQQNLIKFDDELMNPEVKKALEEAQEFLNKRNGNKQATLEELIFSYGCNICNGKTQDYQDIKELTVYQFYKGLERKSLSNQQLMLSTAMGMGGIKPEDVPNWLDHIPEKGLYDDVILNEKEQAELNSKIKDIQK